MMSSRQKHDAREALRTLKLALESIKNGYKFDDDTADLKLKTIARSIERLEEIVNLAAESAL